MHSKELELYIILPVIRNIMNIVLLLTCTCWRWQRAKEDESRKEFSLWAYNDYNNINIRTDTPSRYFINYYNWIISIRTCIMIKSTQMKSSNVP